MTLLAETGQAVRPLILGGDTTSILPLLLATGAKQLICDFAAPAQTCACVTAPLEAMGRLLAGIGPWLDAPSVDADESRLRDELADLARRALAIQTDPKHPAYLRFRGHELQTLVDAAFLAQSILRAPRSLWRELPPKHAGRPRGETLQAGPGDPGADDRSGWVVPSRRTVDLLPLGLAPDAPFWADAEEAWTSVRFWNRSEDIPADHALHEG